MKEKDVLEEVQDDLGPIARYRQEILASEQDSELQAAPDMAGRFTLTAMEKAVLSFKRHRVIESAASTAAGIALGAFVVRRLRTA